MTPDPAAKPRRPILLQNGLNRRHDGVEARLYIQDMAAHVANAEAFAESHHRLVVEQLVHRMDPAAFQAVANAVAAEHQAQEVRAEGDRAQREAGKLQIALAELRADRRMPGQQKLHQERRLQERIDQLNGIHAGNVRDAEELEKRALHDRTQVRRLATDLAAKAVGTAAQALVKEADEQLRQWAAAMPVLALLVPDCHGVGPTQKLAAEVEQWLMSPRVTRHPVGQAEQPMGLDQTVPPEGAQCPECSSPMHWSVRNQRWACVECGCTVTDQGTDFPPYDDPVPNHAQGHRPPAQVRMRRGPAAPPMTLNGETYQLPDQAAMPPTNAAPPADPRAMPPFPYYENWPPLDGADPDINAVDQPGLHRQDFTPAGGSDGTPGNPYEVAQRAMERARQMQQRGVQEQPMHTPSLVAADPTVPFDRSNGGWNPPAGANNMPGGFDPASVEAAARGTFLSPPQTGGPVVELGPNDMPGL